MTGIVAGWQQVLLLTLQPDAWELLFEKLCNRWKSYTFFAGTSVAFVHSILAGYLQRQMA